MEITLTYIAQIAHFFIIWYLFHILLLKRVFTLIHKRKKEIVELSHSISRAQQLLQETLVTQQERKKELLTVFAQKMPPYITQSQELDTTVMPTSDAELTQAEEKKVIDQTTEYIIKRMQRDN